MESPPPVTEIIIPSKSGIWPLIVRWAIGFSLIAILSYIYWRGATYNAQFVNRNASLGDQSSYMEYARDIYHNRHDAVSNTLGDRNRMPGYPFLQSFFYDAAKSDPIVRNVSFLQSFFTKSKTDLKIRHSDYDPEKDRDFFERGKTVNICLSIVLLILLFFIFRIYVPTLAASSVTLVLAFGVFIFKAGYFQAELLFYFAFFISFLLMVQSLKRPSLWLGALTGIATGLAQLVKAGMLPLLCIFIAVWISRELVVAANRICRPASPPPAPQSKLLRRIGSLLLTVTCFVATIWPYIQTSKRVFGQYFYNVNSTFYIWYDNWRDVDNPKTGTKAHGDRSRWPDIAPELLPSPSKYWREHSAAQIRARLSKGFEAMIRESYDHFWYLKYLCLFLLLAVALIACRPSAWWRTISSTTNWVVVVFLALCLGSYLTLTAFYAPISASGTTRFLLVNIAPLLFAIAWLSSREPFKSAALRLGSLPLTSREFHGVIILMMLSDIPFAVWPRLMDLSKFGGY